jgi:putative ABC transport system permease protein
MNFFSVFHVSLGALLVNKGRSILTSLGIVIGISAVIAMVSSGKSVQNWLDDRLGSIGKNLILIRPGARTGEGAVADSAPLYRADAEDIRKQVKSLKAVAEVQQTVRLATAGSRSCASAVVGSVPDLRDVRKWQIHGKYLSAQDVQKVASVCVIGETVRKKLFPDTRYPIGQMIRVDPLHLRIIGVQEAKGTSLTGGDQDDNITIPITTFQQKLSGDEKLGQILAAAKTVETLKEAKKGITKVMRDRHHLKPGAAADFDVSSLQEISEIAVKVTDLMGNLIIVIASISMLVGGIGIMNIMLASVTERTREIGIRMAVGATPANVLIQFVMEAMVLALIGGVIGITLGIAAALYLANFAGWPPYISPASIVLAFLVSAGVGIFFGFYPAWKASRLDPIEALRYE